MPAQLSEPRAPVNPWCCHSDTTGSRVSFWLAGPSARPRVHHAPPAPGSARPTTRWSAAPRTRPPPANSAATSMPAGERRPEQRCHIDVRGGRPGPPPACRGGRRLAWGRRLGRAAAGTPRGVPRLPWPGQVSAGAGAAAGRGSGVRAPASRRPTSARTHLTDGAGKPVCVETEILTSVPLHVGAGYNGDPDWSHGRWMGRNWSSTSVRDLTAPEVAGRIPWGVTDHLARAAMDGEEGWGLFEHASI